MGLVGNITVIVVLALFSSNQPSSVLFQKFNFKVTQKVQDQFPSNRLLKKFGSEKKRKRTKFFGLPLPPPVSILSTQELIILNILINNKLTISDANYYFIYI